MKPSKVYFSQEPKANRNTGTRPNLTPAEVFGEITFLLGENYEAFRDPKGSREIIADGLKNFDPKTDYICRTHWTDPVADFNLCFALASKFPKKTAIKMLQWTKDSNSLEGGHYYPIVFTT